MSLSFVLPCILLGLALAAPSRSFAALPLVPGPAREVAGTHGRFDFIGIDAPRRRLLAAHTQNGTLDVIDLDRGELVKAAPTGAAQDCVVDAEHHQYLVSVSKPPQLALVDAESLAVTATIPLEGPADLLAWHRASGLAYVCHDDGKELWVVSPEQHKVLATVALSTDSPEDLCFDPADQRLFQAMKTAGTVEVIDLATNRCTVTWPTAPVKSPHGMVAVPESGALAISGGNGQMVLMSQEDGRILSSVEIPEKVDEVAYDAELHRVYAASGLGKIAVLEVKENRLEPLGEVPSAPGARSIAVDPKTHTVWVAYAKDQASYVQSFALAP